MTQRAVDQQVEQVRLPLVLERDRRVVVAHVVDQDAALVWLGHYDPQMLM